MLPAIHALATAPFIQFLLITTVAAIAVVARHDRKGRS